jgi:hypothetical protein
VNNFGLLETWSRNREHAMLGVVHRLCKEGFNRERKANRLRDDTAVVCLENLSQVRDRNCRHEHACASGETCMPASVKRQCRAMSRCTVWCRCGACKRLKETFVENGQDLVVASKDYVMVSVAANENSKLDVRCSCCHSTNLGLWPLLLDLRIPH